MLRLPLLCLLICFLTDVDNTNALRIIGPAETATKPIYYLTQVRIQHSSAKGLQICGGCILQHHWVLTAANCFDAGFDDIFRVAIVVNKVQLGDEADQWVYEVSPKNVFIHEDYLNTRFRKQNDIALLKIIKPIGFTNSIKAARLPRKDQVTDHKTGILAGWGRTSDSSPNNANILRYTELEIIPDKTCKDIAIANYELGYSSIFNTTTYLCTNSNESISCNGDNGGPLVIDKNIVVGIVSHHISDWCKRGLPDIYTRVTSYLDWIRKISGVTS